MKNATWFPFRSAGAGTLTQDRLNGLTDGVVSIVLTLLVLGIDVPTDHDFPKEGLLTFLMKIEYTVTVYAVSFVIIGTYWMQHNAMFHYFAKVTRKLTWLNLIFLFLLTLLPFTTQMIGTYRYEPLAIVVYGVVNIACGISLAMIWWYGSGRASVIWPNTDPAVGRSLFVRILSGPLLSLIAIGVAFYNVRASHFVFLMMPLLNISHRSVDSHWEEVSKADTAQSNSVG